uniref:Uncharacterized protein n=1 Tax=Arundo donax TaxID=35708 RepID=A0A0A9FJB9_ARUDO
MRRGGGSKRDTFAVVGRARAPRHETSAMSLHGAKKGASSYGLWAHLPDAQCDVDGSRG